MNIERIKEIREDRDLLQKDIAKVLNIKQQSYSRYEMGLIPLPTEKINILAEYYNVSTDYLLNRTDEKRPYPKGIYLKSKEK
ncbi:MAG: helix-turn-helix transcriptional regulator [Clostridia bacterium]